MQFKAPKQIADPRLSRILFSIGVSIVATTLLAGFLWADMAEHPTHRAAGGLFGLMFLFPLTLGFAAAMAVLFIWLEGIAQRRGPNTPRTTIAHGLLLAASTLSGYANPFLGAFCLFLFIYWLMTGRVAGQKGWSFRPFRSTRWDEKLYITAMVLLFTSMAVTATKSFLAIAYYDLARPEIAAIAGTPPYKKRFPSHRDVTLPPALNKFPDPQSCLTEGADARIREDLLRMDWERITTDAEAKVCMFRLLHEYGSVADAQEWLEAQGFRVGNSMNSAAPYIDERENTRQVAAGWHIQTKGPRYPTSGPLRRVLRAIPYGMSVNATYSAEDDKLLHVTITTSTL